MTTRWEPDPGIMPVGASTYAIGASTCTRQEPTKPDKQHTAAEQLFMTLAGIALEEGLRDSRELSIAMNALPFYAHIRLHRCIRAAWIIHRRNKDLFRRLQDVRGMHRTVPGYLNMEDL